MLIILHLYEWPYSPLLHPFCDILCPTVCPGKVSSSSPSPQPLALLQQIVWHQRIRGWGKKFRAFICYFVCTSLKSWSWLCVSLTVPTTLFSPFDPSGLEVGITFHFWYYLDDSLSFSLITLPTPLSIHSCFNKLFSVKCFCVCLIPARTLTNRI